MTMHQALHPRCDIDRLSVSRKEGKRFVSIEGSFDASTQGLEEYIFFKVKKYLLQQPETTQAT